MSKSPQKEGVRNELTVVKYLKDNGYLALRHGEVGFPDIVVFKDDEFQFFVEVKTPKHTVHKKQREYHKKLKDLGFEIRIIEVLEGEVTCKEYALNAR